MSGIYENVTQSRYDISVGHGRKFDRITSIGGILDCTTHYKPRSQHTEANESDETLDAGCKPKLGARFYQLDTNSMKFWWPTALFEPWLYESHQSCAFPSTLRPAWNGLHRNRGWGCPLPHGGLRFPPRKAIMHEHRYSVYEMQFRRKTILETGCDHGRSCERYCCNLL